MKPTAHSVFMADFAATDRRSVHAHLLGCSRRAWAYIALETLCRLAGHRDRAPGIFRRLSRWLFVRHQYLQRLGRQALASFTALAGLVCGALVYAGLAALF